MPQNGYSAGICECQASVVFQYQPRLPGTPPSKTYDILKCVIGIEVLVKHAVNIDEVSVGEINKIGACHGAHYEKIKGKKQSTPMQKVERSCHSNAPMMRPGSMRL